MPACRSGRPIPPPRARWSVRGHARARILGRWTAARRSSSSFSCSPLYYRDGLSPPINHRAREHAVADFCLVLFQVVEPLRPMLDLTDWKGRMHLVQLGESQHVLLIEERVFTQEE